MVSLDYFPVHGRRHHGVVLRMVMVLSGDGRRRRGVWRGVVTVRTGDRAAIAVRRRIHRADVGDVNERVETIVRDI